MAYSKQNIECSDTVYMVMTDRFFDGDPKNNGLLGAEYQPGNLHFYQGGDWAGLRQKLPYIKDLGFTAIWMSAPQDNELYSRTGDEAGYHGYYTRDFNSPNPHFGTPGELHALLEDAEKLGLKIIIDAQLNHTADYLAYPSRQYDPPEYRPAPPFDNPDWYHHTPNILNFDDPYEAQNNSLGGLDDLAQENPDCWQALMDAYWKAEDCSGWFSYGFAGSRVDAVVEIPPEYLARYEKHTGKRSFGEAFTGSAGENASFQQYLWGMLDYPLYFQLHNCLCRKEDWGGIRWILHQDYLYKKPHQLFTFLDNHDRARFLANCGDNVSLLYLGLALIYSLRGIPVVYYGTEQNMAGDYRFTEETINEYNREMMCSFEQNNSTFSFIQRLNMIRREYTEILAYGTLRELYYRAGDPVYAFRRDARNGCCMLCVFNKAPKEQKRIIEVGKVLHNDYRNLLDTEKSFAVRDEKLELTIPAYGALLLASGTVSAFVPTHTPKTKIIIRYDTGFGNTLFIRGDTLPLRWDSGHRCENVDENTWIFETERPQSGEIQFKVLLNDTIWEKGDNHFIAAKSEAEYIPSF